MNAQASTPASTNTEPQLRDCMLLTTVAESFPAKLVICFRGWSPESRKRVIEYYTGETPRRRITVGDALSALVNVFYQQNRDALSPFADMLTLAGQDGYGNIIITVNDAVDKWVAASAVRQVLANAGLTVE